MKKQYRCPLCNKYTYRLYTEQQSGTHSWNWYIVCRGCGFEARIGEHKDKLVVHSTYGE